MGRYRKIVIENKGKENSLRTFLNDPIEIVIYWNRISKTKGSKFVTHRLDTETVSRILKWLKRNKLNVREDYLPFKIQYIKFAMKTFDKLVKQEYIDLRAKKIGITAFFKGETFRQAGAIKRDKPFYNLVANRKKLKKFLLFRGNPKEYRIASERLKELYKLLVLEEKRVRYSAKQEDQFKLAGKRLVRYMINNTKLNYLNYTQGATLNDFIIILIDALKWQYKHYGFGIGHLCSNYTFNEILPKYIAFHKPK